MRVGIVGRLAFLGALELGAALAGVSRAAPTPAGSLSVDAAASAPSALSSITATEAPTESAVEPRAGEIVLEHRPAGAGFRLDAQRQEDDEWKRPVPKLPKASPEPATQAPAALFGLGATPTAPPRDMTEREPEFHVREPSRAAAPRGLAGTSQASGEESVLRLDAAVPVIRGVVGWARANRDMVLVAALVVLALTWARARRTGRLGAAAISVKPTTRRRHRRHRHRHRHHSHRHSADARGSSSASSRSSAGALAATGASRSSGRHK